MRYWFERERRYEFALTEASHHPFRAAVSFYDDHEVFYTD